MFNINPLNDPALTKSTGNDYNWILVLANVVKKKTRKDHVPSADTSFKENEIPAASNKKCNMKTNKVVSKCTRLI